MDRLKWPHSSLAKCLVNREWMAVRKKKKTLTLSAYAFDPTSKDLKFCWFDIPSILRQTYDGHNISNHEESRRVTKGVWNSPFFLQFQWYHQLVWWFPNMEVPQLSSILVGFSKPSTNWGTRILGDLHITTVIEDLSQSLVVFCNPGCNPFGHSAAEIEGGGGRANSCALENLGLWRATWILRLEPEGKDGLVYPLVNKHFAMVSITMFYRKINELNGRVQ